MEEFLAGGEIDVRKREIARIDIDTALSLAEIFFSSLLVNSFMSTMSSRLTSLLNETKTLKILEPRAL
jgi:hypothetical protein